MREAVRLTRSGGSIRLIEAETWTTNNTAYERLSSLYTHALRLAGYQAKPGGQPAGLVPLLSQFLREAGCQRIQREAHTMDFSAGQETFQDMYHNLLTFMRLRRAFLLRMGVTTKAEFEQFHRQASLGMLMGDFWGLWLFFNVWGEKP